MPTQITDIQVPISDAEWEVMRIIWTLSSVSSKQVIELLGDKMGWKPATIKTLLGRLVKKQAVHATQDGRAYVYTPAIDEQQAMDTASYALFNHLCEMKIGKTLIDVINQVTLSKDDIAQLQQLLTNKVKTAPEKVPCNCLAETEQC